MRFPPDPLRRDRRAVAVLEFAAVAPVFILLLVGIVGFSLYLATDIAIVAAATEGARASIAGMTDAERDTLARRAVSAVLANYAPMLSPANAAIATGGATGGGVFQVTVSYPMPAGFTALVPVPTTPHFTATVNNGGY